MGGGGLVWMSKEVSREVPQRDTILSLFCFSFCFLAVIVCAAFFFFWSCTFSMVLQLCHGPKVSGTSQLCTEIYETMIQSKFVLF